MNAYINDLHIFSASGGVRIETDTDGRLISAVSITEGAIPLSVNGTSFGIINKNETLTL
jgi:hypothetical protein